MDIFRIAYVLHVGNDVKLSGIDCLKANDGEQIHLDKSSDAISLSLFEEFLSLKSKCLLLKRENKKLEITNKTKPDSFFTKMNPYAKTKRNDRSDDKSSPRASKEPDNCPDASMNNQTCMHATGMIVCLCSSHQVYIAGKYSKSPKELT